MARSASVVVGVLQSRLTGVLATVGICRYLAETLRAPLVVDAAELTAPVGVLVLPWFTVFTVTQLEEWERAIRAARVVICVQNDYSIGTPVESLSVGWFVTRAFGDRNRAGKPNVLWTTIPTKVRLGTLDHYMNWNCINYTAPGALMRPPGAGAVYWGAFRKERRSSFDRHCAPGSALTVYSPLQSAKRFAAAYPHLAVRTKLARVSDLASHYGATVYLEDDRQHREFHSLGARLYEALSMRMAVFVDSAAQSTFAAGGYNAVEEMVVAGATDLRARLPLTDKVRRTQQHWHARAAEEQSKLRFDVLSQIKRIKKEL